PPASPPSGSGARAAAAVAWDRGCPAPWRRRRRQRWKRRTRDGTGGRTHGTPGQGDGLVLPARATAVNLLHQGCGDTVPTVDEQERAALERLRGALPPPSPHRLIIAGIRLAEIYRTHQKDAAKADALIARLAAEHPDAPELKYVRSISG